VTWNITTVPTSELCVDTTSQMKEEYFSSLASASLHNDANSKSTIKFVNTSMHGVSNPYVTRAFEVYGFKSFIPVKEQQVPNPDCQAIHDSFMSSTYITVQFQRYLFQTLRRRALWTLP
jgi:phosphomannomutase